MNKLWKMKIHNNDGWGEVYLTDDELMEYVLEITQTGGIVNSKDTFVPIHFYSVNRFQ